MFRPIWFCLLSVAAGLVVIPPNASAVALPEGRKYELVSPSDKLNSDVEPDTTARSSSSGDSVTYVTKATATGNSAIVFNQQMSSRGPAGWDTRNINPPVDPFAAIAPDFAKYEAFSPDLSKGVAYTWAWRAAGGAETYNLYLHTAATGQFVLLSRPFSPIAPENPAMTLRNTRFVGASKSFDRVVFESHRALTPNAPPEGNGQRYLYRWDRGTIELISILPNGEPAIGAVAAGFGSVAEPDMFYPGEHVVSDDGSRVYFSSGGNVYLWEEGRPAQRVSEFPGDANLARFEAASADGSIAFVSSGDRLTPDATATPARRDLYRYVAASGALTDETTADPSGGGVLGVVGSSERGDRLYFVATSVLAAGAEAGMPNLYLREDGSGLRFVATLAEGDGAVWSSRRIQGPLELDRFRDARVTADGRHLLFGSRRALTGYPTAGFVQLYRYDAVTRSVLCVSCNRRQPASTGNAWLKTRTRSSWIPIWLPRNMTEDGGRIFFDTSEALDVRDSNGTFDVYEWRDGRQDLLSSGQSDEASSFVDASLSGDDVFITTREQLVSGDGDALVDMYDARVNGGFPDALPPAQCFTDDCQGGSSAPPLFATPGTESLRANATPGAERRKRVMVSKLRVDQLARLARGGAVKLRVKVARAGKLTVSGRARLAGRSLMVLSSQTQVNPGVRAIEIRLIGEARRYLRGPGRVIRVTLRASITGGKPSEPVTVSVKQ